MSPDGEWKSTDGGCPWQAVPEPLHSRIVSLAVAYNIVGYWLGTSQAHFAVVGVYVTWM